MRATIFTALRQALQACWPVDRSNAPGLGRFCSRIQQRYSFESAAHSSLGICFFYSKSRSAGFFVSKPGESGHCLAETARRPFPGCQDVDFSETTRIN